MLTVLGIGGAVLGIVQSPKESGLRAAVTNTLAASNYTEDLSEVTSQANQSEHLVFEAPNRLAGYVQSGAKRQYVVIIGSVAYQTGVVSTSTPTDKLVFKKQATGEPNAAVSSDPVHTDLPFVKKAKNVKQDGDVSTFTLTQQGGVELFHVTVAGQFVSDLSVTATAGRLHLAISSINGSPSVQVPTGAKVSSSSGSSSAG